MVNRGPQTVVETMRTKDLPMYRNMLSMRRAQFRELSGMRCMHASSRTVNSMLVARELDQNYLKRTCASVFVED